MGFASVFVPSPAKIIATGRALAVVTINEPASPGPLKLLSLITTWPTNLLVNRVGPPQKEAKSTLTVPLMLPMVEQVRPVVRPVFATDNPNAGASSVVEGGAAAMLSGPGTPKSRMLPEASTEPGTTCASAASTLLSAIPLLVGVGCNADWKLRLATVEGEAKQAADPGWLIASPGSPCPERASTWLLLKMYCEPLKFQRLPRVPTQQTFGLVSSPLPPVMPNLIGSVCAPAVSFG